MKISKKMENRKRDRYSFPSDVGKMKIQDHTFQNFIMHSITKSLKYHTKMNKQILLCDDQEPNRNTTWNKCNWFKLVF